MEFESWKAPPDVGALLGLTTEANPMQKPSTYGNAFSENAPPYGVYGNYPGNNAAMSPAVAVLQNVWDHSNTIRVGEPVYIQSSVNPDTVENTLKKAVLKLASNVDAKADHILRNGVVLHNNREGESNFMLHAKEWTEPESVVLINMCAGILMAKDKIPGVANKYRVSIAVEHFVTSKLSSDQEEQLLQGTHLGSGPVVCITKPKFK